MEKAVSLLGILVFVGIAAAASRNRQAIPWKMVAMSLAIQLVLAFLLLQTIAGAALFTRLGQLAAGLLNFSSQGSEFVFGSGLNNPGGPVGFVFAVKVLPTIIFFGALMNVAYYLGWMQLVVAQIARLIRRLLGTSGAETLCASANIFLGQTEAPLLIRPYLLGLTESELFVVMVSGFATMAAGVIFVYAGMLGTHLPQAAGHLLTASVLSAPASLMMAKIIIPETQEPATRGQVKLDLPSAEGSLIEAASAGASTGLNMALNVGAMLIAFISLVALLNGALALLFSPLGTKVSLELLLGYLFAPAAFLLGMPSSDLLAVGGLIGKGFVLNEFIAYSELNTLIQQNQISPRASILAIYALCGFTNLSSVGIQIGGIGALADPRKADLARLGMLGLLAAALANFQTAALAGLLI